ncbi:MAG: hypothetical protein ACYCT1_20575 [Steroidobacteraceae bacterium]
MAHTEWTSHVKEVFKSVTLSFLIDDNKVKLADMCGEFGAHNHPCPKPDAISDADARQANRHLPQLSTHVHKHDTLEGSMYSEVESGVRQHDTSGVSQEGLQGFPDVAPLHNEALFHLFLGFIVGLVGVLLLLPLLQPTTPHHPTTS